MTGEDRLAEDEADWYLDMIEGDWHLDSDQASKS